MEFWRSVSQAAEKAKAFAENATEEAAKKLKDLKLHETVGTGISSEKAPAIEELEYFGITSEFQEFIRTLSYSTFRDFPSEHLVPLQSGEAGVSHDYSNHQQLNPWQAKHARLVCQINEVNELRYVLCPRYMTDEHFWHVYFTIVKKYLPEKAYHWTDQDVLPAVAGAENSIKDVLFLNSIGNQIKRIGSRLQQSGRSLGREGNAIELAPTASRLVSAIPSAGETGSRCSDEHAEPASVASMAAAEASNSQPAGATDDDPGLEAYLQVAIDETHGSSTQEEYDDNDDDLDLDSYINEISAEVEEAEKA